MAEEIGTKMLERIQALQLFAEHRNLQSYDPYDGLSSKFVDLITFDNQLLRRVIQQAVLRSPLNLRPILGIKKMLHTKTISDYASGFSLLYAITCNQFYKEQCLYYLEELNKIASVNEKGRAWGLRFPFATRFVNVSSYSLNIFQTVNAINAYLDANAYLDIVINLEPVFESINYIQDVFGYVDKGDFIYWRYWQGLEQEIFNVNGLMLGVLSKVYKITSDPVYLDLALKTYKYLAIRQNKDGSWFYAKGEKAKFIDGFHTGYIIEGICQSVLAGCIKVNDTISLAFDFYSKKLFTEDCFPKYYHNRVRPYDIQNCAQAIQTLSILKEVGYVRNDWILNTFQKVDAMFWNNKGYYDFRKANGLFYETPMHRWATGPMFLALAYALYNLKKNDE